MKISRTVTVARTAHDRTHVNHLVIPEHGVIELRLEKGTNKSVSYLLHDAKPPRPPTTGGVDTFHFAPGPQLDSTTWAVDPGKNDRVKLKYNLFNPFLTITEAKLELFRRFDKDAFWTRELKDDELFDGDHELEFEYEKSDKSGNEKKNEWDGSLGAESNEYPDGFLTVEHSPYKLRLTVKGEEARCLSPVAWTYFHVLIAKLEIEYGDIETISFSDADDKKKQHRPFTLLKTDHPDPKTGGPLKIHLHSNIFKAGHSMFDNSLHDEYRTMWEHGPQIPLYAKIWVRDSADGAVHAPKALGNTRFLWDWESKAGATGNDFVDKAQNYHKTSTKPPGQNCHEDRGGKRKSDDLVFPKHDGYDAKDSLDEGVFPFEVKSCGDPRKWASFSKPWRRGKLASKTGVMFQPARTAGDSYKLTVYAAHEIIDEKRKLRLHVDTDPPLKIDSTLKAESGTFEVWRRVNYRRIMLKKAFPTAGVAGLRSFYTPAFLDIEDNTPAVENYPSADWNSRFQTVYNGWSAFRQLMVDPTTDQHAGDTAGVIIRTRGNLRTHVKATFALSDPDVDQWLVDNGMPTDGDYAAARENDCIEAMKTLFDAVLHADDGVNLFHVEYSHQLIPQVPSSFTDGLAHNFASGSDRKCGFLWLAPTSLYAPAIPEQTPAHEFGHHFMLPHPRGAGENTGAKANNDYKAHDRSVTNCLMSYVDAVREVCGFCRLRLRGWSKDALDPDKAKNQKS
jgi:hypothetical protein